MDQQAYNGFIADTKIWRDMDDAKAQEEVQSLFSVVWNFGLAVSDDRAFQTKELLEAAKSLALDAKSPEMSVLGAGLLERLATLMPDYASRHAIDTWGEMIHRNLHPEATLHAVEYLKRTAGWTESEQYDGNIRRTGEIFAEMMGSQDPALRQHGLDGIRHSVAWVKTRDEWEQELSPVFRAAARKNGIGDIEIASLDAKARKTFRPDAPK